MVPASPALSQIAEIFSEEQGLKGKKSTVCFSPPKVCSASKVWTGKETHLSHDSAVGAEGRRDLEAQTSESLSHLLIELWEFPLFIIHLIATFFYAFMHPLPPGCAGDPNVQPREVPAQVPYVSPVGCAGPAASQSWEQSLPVPGAECQPPQVPGTLSHAPSTSPRLHPAPLGLMTRAGPSQSG